MTIVSKLNPPSKSADFQNGFRREDWTLFRSLNTLGQKAGVPVHSLARLAMKEVVDNALDASGACTFDVTGAGAFWVENAGDIPGTDGELAGLFSIGRPLISSKLLRLPTRGALGNGLRVVVGAVLASGGRMVLSTGGRTLELKPMDNGETVANVVDTFPSGKTRLDVKLGPAIARDGIDGWAKRAQLLATGPMYAGRTSPFWYDSDSFVELLLASGTRTVRDLVAEFDGCTGATAGRISAPYRGRRAAEVDRDEADTLLQAMRAASRPVRPERLGYVGPIGMLPAAYVRETGMFVIFAARGNVSANIPFVVEAWAELADSAMSTEFLVHVNRTPMTGESSAEWHGKSGMGVFGGGLGHKVKTKEPMRFWLNIITPYMPITTDGKEPDLGRFTSEIINALERVAAKAHRRVPRTTLAKRKEKDIVFDCLPEAIKKASGGHRFSQRQVFYAVRPYVLAKLEKEPNYDYFAKLLTDYEAQYGDIPGMYRDNRGSLYHPHLREVIPLGTLAVEKYRRPEYCFNRLLYSEKEGFFEMLRDVKWPERHDCALLTSKGFASRAARDVIDRLGDTDEEITFYCIHDADASGTLIYEKLQEGTTARPGRRVRIVNLGLEPDEALAMGLDVEKVDRKKKATAVAGYVSKEWAQWLKGHRIELNAMPTPLFLEWLDRKFEEHAPGKLVPPTDVLRAELAGAVEGQVQDRVRERILREAGFDDQVAAAVDELHGVVDGRAGDLDRVVSADLATRPERSWRAPVVDVAASILARLDCSPGGCARNNEL